MSLVRLTTSGDEPFDLAAAKQQLVDVPGDADDAYIRDVLIPTVREAAEDRTGYVLRPGTFRLALDCFPRVVELERFPVTVVSAVRYYDDEGVLQTLASDQYETDLDSRVGRIVPAYGVIWPTTRYGKPGAVRVEFTAGFATPAAIPAPVVHWMKLALTDLYENRGRSGERPMVPRDFAEHLLTNGHERWRP